MVASKKMGILLMRCLGLGLWIAWMFMEPASAVEHSASQACQGTVLPTIAGERSELTDCQIWELFSQAELRSGIEACFQRYAPKEAEISFSFRLYPKGGISTWKEDTEPRLDDQATHCLVEVFTGGFWGEASGSPILVSGRLEKKKTSGTISLSLFGSATLPPPPPPLLGPFASLAGADITFCNFEGVFLVLAVGPETGLQQAVLKGMREIQKKSTADRIDHARQLTEACLEKVSSETGPNPNPRLWLKLRAQAFKCLTNLLQHADWEIRAKAAEALAEGQFNRSRRSLIAAIEKTIQGISKDPLLGSSSETTQQGLALLRMVKAYLRLQSWIKEGFLGALVQHPSRLVRLMLIRDVFSRSTVGLPVVAQELFSDPDALVRAQAYRLGCQRGLQAGRDAFFKDLAHPEAHVRAGVALYARNCFSHGKARLTGILEKEVDPTVALLILDAMPSISEPLRQRWVSFGLESPCPIHRYLASKLLSTTSNKEKQILQDILKRESLPLLQKHYRALLDPKHHVFPAKGEKIRLWLQAEPAPSVSLKREP